MDDDEEMDIEILLHRLIHQVAQIDYRLSKLEAEVSGGDYEPLVLH